jgi:hypothetical protein
VKRVRAWRTIAALALAGALAATCNPHERRPGLWVTGEVVRAPVTDWSFVDGVPTIAVETRTWYGIPHSVTTICVRHGGALYVPSRDPRGKRWVKNVLRDPRVRLRIGDRVYARRAVRVTDPDEIAALGAAIVARHPQLRPAAGAPAPEVWFFRMEPGDG